MAAPLILHDYELDANCYKVRLGLALLGLEWQRVAVDVLPGREHLTLPYLAMNPTGRLPILRDGECVMHGAEAILAYLARTYDSSGRWLPPDGKDFAMVMQWLNFSALDLHATMAARDHALFDAPGDVTALRIAACESIRIMDDHMTTRGFARADFFAAGHATIADIALFPAFALCRDSGIDHDEYPALRRWARRLRALPGFKAMPGIPDYH